MIKTLNDTSARIRAGKARKNDFVVNRVLSGASTIAIGGSVAAVATFYIEPPEPIHAHITALIIFAVNTAIALMSEKLK